jgi:dsDNA-specific endonuclease/ATPase MutS2
MNIQRKEFYGVKQQFMADMDTGNFQQQLNEIFGMKRQDMIQKQISTNHKLRKEIEIYTNPHVRQI